MMHKKNSGNVFIYILLDIFLLGILTTLISNIGSTTKDNARTENVSLVASRLINYGASLQTAVQSLINRGCSETELSFYYQYEPNGTPEDYLNPNAKPECEVFGPKGANMNYIVIPKEWRDTKADFYARSIFSADYCINGVGTTDPTCTTRTTDLRLLVVGIKKDICVEINRRLGIENAPDGEVPYDRDNTRAFKGSYASATTGTVGIIARDEEENAVMLKGKKAACMLDPGGESSPPQISFLYRAARPIIIFGKGGRFHPAFL